jgi:hypothetical protein
MFLLFFIVVFYFLKAKATAFFAREAVKKPDFSKKPGILHENTISDKRLDRSKNPMPSQFWKKDGCLVTLVPLAQRSVNPFQLTKISFDFHPQSPVVGVSFEGFFQITSGLI